MSPRPNLRFGQLGVVGLLLGCSMIAWSDRGHAEGRRSFELTWNAPPECPSLQEVERDVARLIGEGSHERTVRASATVTSSEEGWRVRVRMETDGEISERSLSAPTCRALEKAVALVVGITIEPGAATGEPPAPPTPPSDAHPPNVPPPAVLRERRTTKWFAVLGPTTEVGLLPRLGMGAKVSFGLKLPMFSAELAGALYAAENANSQGSAGGRFTLASAGLRACGRLFGEQVELFGCADTVFHRLAARGFGVTTPGSAKTTLVAFGLGPRVDVRLTPTCFLLFELGASYAPGRANFVLDNLGRVYTATHLEMSGRLGVAIQF